jgi:hypothetical protein
MPDATRCSRPSQSWRTELESLISKSFLPIQDKKIIFHNKYFTFIIASLILSAGMNIVAVKTIIFRRK